MNINEIYLGDAYELIKQIPDKSIDLIVTDPPYEFCSSGANTGIFKDRDNSRSAYNEIAKNGLDQSVDLSILDEFVRVLKKINVYLWCNKEQIYDYMTYFVKERGCNFEFIIWAKTNPPPFIGGHYLKDKEYCLYFWESGCCKPESAESAKTVYVSQINKTDKDKYGHPTIKPQSIIENLIKNSTREGGVILDPFLGSGTTACAAKATKRHYLGFEINERYYKIACDRINGITQREAKAGYVQEKLF